MYHVHKGYNGYIKESSAKILDQKNWWRAKAAHCGKAGRRWRTPFVNMKWLCVKGGRNLIRGPHRIGSSDKKQEIPCGTYL